MSHIITTKTKITDKKLAIQALKKAGWSFSEGQDSTSLQVTSGPMASASINLKTGAVTGDSDHLNRGDDSMGALKMLYSEALFNQEVLKQGMYAVHSRRVDSNGEIVVTCKKFA